MSRQPFPGVIRSPFLSARVSAAVDPLALRAISIPPIEELQAELLLPPQSFPAEQGPSFIYLILYFAKYSITLTATVLAIPSIRQVPELPQRLDSLCVPPRVCETPQLCLAAAPRERTGYWFDQSIVG